MHNKESMSCQAEPHLNNIHKNNLRPVIFVIGAIIVVFTAFLFRNKTFLGSFFSFDSDKDIKFELVESSPDNYTNNFSSIGQPTFVFSKKLEIEETDLKNYFEINPDISGAWHIEKNKQVVYFSADRKQKNSLPQLLKYDTTYTVTLKKGIPSVSGETMNKEEKIIFKTQKHPLFNLNADKKMIYSLTNQPVKIEFYNTQQNSLKAASKYKIEIKSIPVQEVLNYFTYHKERSFFYKINNDSKLKNISSFEGELLNSDKYSPYITLPSFTEPGLYYIKLSNQYGSEDLVVAVNEHINQSFFDTKTATVWTTNTTQGNSLANVKTELYSVKNGVKLISSSVTDQNGVLKTEIKDNKVDFVVTSIGGDIALTYTEHFSIAINSQLDIFSYTDRPVYRPGDTVHYKAVIRQKENGSFTIPSNKVYLNFLTKSYDSINDDKYEELTIDPNGTVTKDIILPQNIRNLTPIITLAIKEDGEYKSVDSHYLKVESYRKPDMDVSATTDDIEYISQDSAHFTASAKTLFGQPLSNIDFSYRVMVNNYSEIKNRKLESIQDSDVIYYGDGKEVANGKGKFDAKGKADIDFSTDLIGFEDSQIAVLEITPNLGASPSIGKVAKLIHRGEFAIFFENIKSNTENGITGDILILDHQNERRPVKDVPLTVSLYKLTTSNQSTNKELLKEETASSSADGLFHFSFPQTEKGNYELVTVGKDPRNNTVTSRYSIYLDKEQTVNNIITKNITLSTDSETFQPGQTVNVILSSNFNINDAAIIVTRKAHSGYFNSAVIQSFDIKKVNGTSLTIPISIDPSADQPLGVSVFATAEGVAVSGFTQIDVDTTHKKLETSVYFDKKVVAPGETVKAQITTKDKDGNPVSADTSLAVIDAAVLQIGKIGDNIYDSFYGSNYPAYISNSNSTSGIYKELRGGGGGCFLERTPITMSGNSFKNIEDVRVGDKILTRESDHSNKLVEDTVTHTFRHLVNEYLIINGSLYVTSIHRIFVNNQWQEAKEASIGDSLIDQQGNSIVIHSIERKIGQVVVYNLTTKNQHTFFAQGIYVHNEKGPEPRQNFADTAYWNPHIKTDSTGNASISFKAPDNITTFTAHVYANTVDSQVGQQTSEFISYKDLVIIPALPQFYFEDDEPIVTSIIQNSSDKKIQGEFLLSIKELGIKKKQSITINPHDFEIVSFPLNLNTSKKTLSFLLEMKDLDDKTLDSVLLEKPLLPQETIVNAWQAFEESKSIHFAPTYPQANFNYVQVDIIPHLAYLLNKDYSTDFYGGLSEESNLRLYAMSYILAQTNEGNIPPHMYHYAHLKNSYRYAINNILINAQISDKGSYWWHEPEYSTSETYGMTTITAALALQEASNNKNIVEITNLSSFIEGAKTTIVKNDKQDDTEHSTNKSALMVLLFPNSGTNCTFVTCYAAQAYTGNSSALRKLQAMILESADDRYFWDSQDDLLAALPALAMIEHGSNNDADKAMRGLSVQFEQYNDSTSLSLLGGVKHALRRNLKFERPNLSISLNKETIFNTDDKKHLQYSFHETFATTSENPKIDLSIETKNRLPFYITTIETTYQDSPFTKTESKLLRLPFARKYRSLTDGKVLNEIPTGQSASIEFIIKNPYASTFDPTIAITDFILYDSIKPQYIYLNQESGNSPQFQSAFDKLYGKIGYDRMYIVPKDYSDQFVLYESTSRQLNNLTLPYTVFNLTEGKHYQPKTSLVFPKTGIIIQEE